MLSVFTSLACYPRRTSGVGEDCRPLEHLKIGGESHRKQEAARWTSLSNSLGHEELSTSRSCKFHMRGAVVICLSQETADELRHFSSLEYPGMFDTRLCGSKILQKNTRLSRGTRNMGKGSCLDLENVIRHLSGGDTSLRGVFASHGVPSEGLDKLLW